MKKILYSLLIFISIFFVVDKVSAADNTISFDLTNSNFITVYDELKPKLDQIQDVLSNNPKNHKYVIFIGKNSTGNFINLYLMANTASYDTSNIYCYINAFSGSVNRLLGGCRSYNSYSPYTFANYSYNSSNESGFNTLITNLSNDILLDWSSNSFLQSRTSGNNNTFIDMNSFSFSNNYYDYFSKNSNFILPYASNVPIYNYYSGNYTLKIGDIAVPAGLTSYLEPSDNYLGEEEPEPYIFDEYIDDIDYSKMIFDFDVDVLASRNYVFDGLFDFSTIGFINPDGIDDSFGDGGVFPKPYLEYTLVDDTKGTIEIFETYYDELERAYWYGTYNESLSNDIVKLRLIIPMQTTYEVRYDINFVSFIPFEVSFELDSELYSYYEEIDLTNKYGVIFMPRLIDNNSYVNSIFDTVGIEQVLVYHSYDYKIKPSFIFDNVSLDFYYNFDLDDIEYNLFMKVENNVTNAFVRYDTRYYTYKIVDSKYSLGNVINPNTGESHYVDFSNTANVSSDFSNISDVFEFISGQLDNQSEAYILFQNSVNTFFNTMPSELYIVILTLFAIILLGVTLGLGGWR